MQKRQLLRHCGGRLLAPCAVSIALGLSACAPVPGFQRAVVGLPDRYSLIAPVTGPAAQDPAWGVVFDDPVFARLLDRGLSDNLTIAQAEQRLNAAEADLRRAGQAVVGDATLEASRSSAGPSTGNLSVEGLLPGFGRTRAATAAATARVDAARLGTLDARRVLMSDLATTYVDLRYYQQLLIYRQGDLRVRRAILGEVRTQIEGGAATRVELIRTQAQVAEAEVQIPVLQATIIRTRNRISTLLGRTVGSLDIDLGFTGNQPEPDRIVGPGVPADMVRARPDIRQAERLYAAAVSDIAAAEAARYPRLTLTGSIRAPFEGGSTIETLVGGLTIPLFSQGALAADVKGAHARANLAFLEWRSRVLMAIEDVEANLVALRAGQDSVAAARRVVALNREALELSREMLRRNGIVTAIDVLDRERAVSESQIVLAQARRDLARSHIGLRVALGLGLGLGGASAGAAAPDVDPQG